MNVERGERLHPIFLFPAHGVLRAETAGYERELRIGLQRRLPETRSVDSTKGWGAIVRSEGEART